MRRLSGTGKPAKPLRRKTAGPKQRMPAEPAPSVAQLQEQVATLTREFSEAREQQIASSEVLKVISSSPGELQPVFETMLAKAVELLGASFGAMWLIDGEIYRIAALHGNLPEAYVKRWRSGALHRPKAVIPMVRATRSRKPVHVLDMSKDKAYREGDPLAMSVVDVAGIRTLVTVPMLKEGQAIGNITIYRSEVRPFSDKQIALVQHFAAQAVIAIENTRLLNELRQRTRDLSEALEQQTATSEVLQIISSSPGDLVPVFNSILANARRICEAKFAHLMLYDGELFHPSAMEGAPPAFVTEFWRGPQALSAATGPGRAVATKQVVHIPDMQETEGYKERDPQFVAMAELTGARAVLIVPMLKDDRVIGIFSTYRPEARPFTDKQIELVRNFAAQAVIAIENTRLLNELRESLQQQTATADVLKVISRSPGELAPVFDAMLESATRICQAAQVRRCTDAADPADA